MERRISTNFGQNIPTSRGDPEYSGQTKPKRISPFEFRPNDKIESVHYLQQSS